MTRTPCTQRHSNAGWTWTFAVGIWVLTVSPLFGATVEEAVAAHAATLAKIETLYLRVELTVGEIDKPPQRMSLTENWRSGTHVRTLQRLYLAVTPKGLKEIPEANRVTQFSFADTESRHLRGWDPEAPLALPLSEVTAANEFGRVKGGIGPRDPQGMTSSDWAAFLLEVSPGLTLADFAKTAKLELVDSPDANTVRLHVIQTDHAALSGGLIDLDLEHGHLIRRLEIPSAKMVAEVHGFTPFGEGVWLPEKVVRTTGKTIVVAQRLDARVNEPMADADLVVAFPEGARVEEVLTKRIHLWGEKGPAHTFESFPQFLEYQKKQMQDANRPERMPINGGTNWLLWINIFGIVALVLLMTFRKRLVQS